MEKTKVQHLPDVPGVYLFKLGRKVLYVGKATSLRDRVRSYFDDDLIATRGPRVVDMVTKADRVAHETTPTVLEALVREAALIRKYRPIGNVEGKDDKTFLYAVVTDEEIPRVLAIRGREIDFQNLKTENFKLKTTFGPFPSGAQLREGLRLIRRIFPFFDTEYPVGQGGKHQKAKIEFNQQIEQYPRSFDHASYMRSIRKVELFFAGRGKELRKKLQKDMRLAAKEERFEDAGEARHQLFALDHIQDVSLIKEDREKGNSEDVRIEAYDTAHISGTNAIGVMTVLQGGVSAKREYRTFRITGSQTSSRSLTSSKSMRHNNDIASLKELLSRRFGHPEWPYPKAIVIDGGKTHKKAADQTLKELGIQIPTMAVVKDDRHRPREVIGALRAGISEADAVLANSEAHRFSLRLHRKARSRNLRV